jgi:D-glycerate 3-kinase
VTSDQWSAAAAVQTFALAQVQHARRRPLVLGLQAPQGAGKTTIGTRVLAALPGLGLHAASVSIDDFYLTRAEQLALAAAHPGNPYLEHRGYPGTHDIALGERTLAELREPGAGRSIRVPVYDKSQHGGRGDRAPESDWRHVTGPIDLVIVEGWMLGFEPVAESQLPDPRLSYPNRALADYDRWYRHLDAFIVLRPLDWNYVVKWRVEAEENMKAQGKPGLSREAIEDYVRRFLPAYAVWAGRPPARIASDRRLVLEIDERRRVKGPTLPPRQSP